MSKYKVILFDVDNTLIDFDIDQKKAYFSAMKEVNINCTDEMYNDYYEVNRGLWHKFDDGKIKLSELFIKRHEIFFEKYNINIDANKFEEILNIEFQKTGTLIKGVKEILDILKKNYILIIITNGKQEQQYKRLENAYLLDYFFKIFISEEIGYSKPDIKFFDIVLESIPNIEKQEILIVGDSISSDILGGINAGIDTCWYNAKKKVKRLNINPTYVISNMDSLLDIIS